MLHTQLFISWGKERESRQNHMNCTFSFVFTVGFFFVFTVPDFHPHGEQSDAEAQNQSPEIRYTHMPHCESRFLLINSRLNVKSLL